MLVRLHPRYLLQKQLQEGPPLVTVLQDDEPVVQRLRREDISHYYALVRHLEDHIINEREALT